MLDFTSQRGDNREGILRSNLGGHNGCGVGAGLNGGTHIIGVDAAVTLCQVAAIGEGCGERNDEGNHGADHEGAHVFSLDGHNAQEAGGTQSNGLHVQQGNQGATNGGGTDTNEKGPAQPQVHTEDSGLGNAQYSGHTGGTSQALELFALGQEEHGQRCGTLGNIGHGCGSEDERTTLLLQLQFDRRERLVQTSNNDGRVDQTKQETTNRAARLVHGLQPMAQGGTEATHDRANNNEGEEARDEQREHRGNKEVRGALELLVEELLNGSQHPGDHEDWQHGALVADLINEQAKQVPLLDGSFSLGLGHLVEVHQVRAQHGHGDAGTQELVTAEPLGCGEAHKDRQEGEWC